MPGAVGQGNAPPPVHVLKLATFCTSQQEFIGQFKAFLDDDTLFLPSKVALIIGQTVEFSICLQDERPMLEGRGEVVHVRPHVGGRSSRSGLRVRVRELTPSSRLIKAAILSARDTGKGTAPAKAATAAATPGPEAETPGPEAPPPTPAPAPRTPSPRVTAPLGRIPPSRVAAPAARNAQPTAEPALVGEELAEAPAPAPPPPAEVQAYPRPSPSGRTGRLFSQGVQVAVPASPVLHDARKDDFDAAPSSPFVEVSTKSIVSSIDSNVNETGDSGERRTPVTMVEGSENAPSADDLQLARKRPGRGSPVRAIVPPLLSSAGTLAVCWFLWGRAPAPLPAAPVVPRSAQPVALSPRPVPAAPVPPPARPEPRPAPAPPPAPVAEKPAAAAPTPDEAPRATPPAAAAPAEGHCSARITSQPSGAVVTLGTRRLGETPVQADHLPCEAVELTLNRPRYAPTNTTVTPGRHGATAFVRLVRPGARLILTSTPPNAVFKVNHAVVTGEAAVMRFERAKIEATLPGHKPWKKVLYVNAPSMTVNAALAPAHGH
jgi:hypothetical protein